MSAPWAEHVTSRPVLEIAKACGLDAQDPRGSSAGSFACPACGVRNRHGKSKDRRLAVGCSPSGGARCFQCGTGFGPFAVLCYALGGGPWSDLPDHKRDEIREWGKRFAGIVDGAPCSPPRAAAPAPVVARAEYPDASDVAALVASCERADEHPDVDAWLQSRALTPSDVADSLMGCALGAGAVVPAWASRWVSSGHRFIVPLFDARGALRSVLARLVRAPLEGERKSLAPAGFARAGLCVLDGLARQMLVDGRMPDWWEPMKPGRIVLCEGEMNAIAHALVEARLHGAGAPATVGVFSGGWTDAHTMRLPRGCEVVVAMDEDQGGETLAEPILKSLVKRRDLAVSRHVSVTHG